MQIDFKKVGFINKELKYKLGSVSLEANIKKENQNLILLHGRLFGEVDFICDRCGEEFSLQIDETLNLKLHNGEVSIDELNDLDIIECFDEKIDIDEILYGEIELIKSDYNYCNKCKKI